jgi:alpha-D-xyloside xylohydrolase
MELCKFFMGNFFAFIFGEPRFLFVKAGSIIPMVNYALSTSAIHNDSLAIHVYPGKDAAFTLYEDDEVSEACRYKNDKRTTLIIIRFNQSSFSLQIAAAAGNYNNASGKRCYQIIFHGISGQNLFLK